jgi:hypothetical protein
MSPDYDKSAVDTEKAQVDRLIEIKKEEISDLEDLKKEVAKGVEIDSVQTPAEVAHDSEADADARSAAANAVLGQDPAKVNYEQSEPSPSTHGDQFETTGDAEATQENEELYAEQSEVTEEDSKDDSEEKSADSKKSDSKSKKASNKKS